MAYVLESLRSTGLTNLEAAQLIKRHQSDISSLNIKEIEDEKLKSYLSELFEKESHYEKAVSQVQISEETKKIQLADDVRDEALSAVHAALALHSKSDLAVEKEAARGISIMMDSYKNLAKLSYEAESIGIDKFVGDMESNSYSGKVSLLGMDRYIMRLKTSNDAFKVLFGKRIVGEALAVTFDTKGLRQDLFSHYKEMCAYLVAMTNAFKTEEYLQILGVINTARKYYSDQLARKDGIKEKNKEKPVVAV